jgi:hypothetical protein
MRRLIVSWIDLLGESGLRPIDHLYGIAVCAVLLLDAVILAAALP